MPITRFPDPRKALAEGLLALGGDLHPESLLLAYRQGIFPWPVNAEVPLAWFCPEERAILEFSEIHVPRSLEKVRRKTPYRLTTNQDFRGVIEACAKVPRPGQPGTWITREMIEAYCEFHRLGYARSAEAWTDGPSGPELVGGLYGVELEGTFAGESMFHFKPNASKLALLHLVDLLKERGILWMDIQMMTPHMEALGARVLSRNAFLRKLSETRARFR